MFLFTIQEFFTFSFNFYSVYYISIQDVHEKHIFPNTKALEKYLKKIWTVWPGF